MKKYLTLLSILLSVTSQAQVWPTEVLVDTPYTKNNDGIIYHTATAHTEIASTTVEIPQIKKQTKTGYNNFHLTEKRCPLCGELRSREHISIRVAVGQIARDRKHLTPLGEWVKNQDAIPGQEFYQIPQSLEKYLPKDYYAREEYYEEKLLLQ